MDLRYLTSSKYCFWGRTWAIGTSLVQWSGLLMENSMLCSPCIIPNIPFAVPPVCSPFPSLTRLFLPTITLHI
jgi:hypothetical protein